MPLRVTSQRNAARYRDHPASKDTSNYRRTTLYSFGLNGRTWQFILFFRLTEALHTHHWKIRTVGKRRDRHFLTSQEVALQRLGSMHRKLDYTSQNLVLFKNRNRKQHVFETDVTSPSTYFCFILRRKYAELSAVY